MPEAEQDTSAMTLTELADYYKTDKGNVKHRYTEIYDRYVRELRDQKINLLEIGVANGCSLKMWHDYFMNGDINGIDIRTECQQLCKNYPRIKITIGDATKLSTERDFDLIIDDGSHISLDIVETFFLQWPRLKKGGLYIIEDLNCTYNDYIWKYFPTYHKDRFSRLHFLKMMDFLMRDADKRIDSQIEFMHYYRELLIVKKMA
jgi:hypothetical protein